MKLFLHHVCFATVDFGFVGIFLMLIFLRCRVNTDERTNKMFKRKKSHWFIVLFRVYLNIFCCVFTSLNSWLYIQIFSSCKIWKSKNSLKFKITKAFPLWSVIEHFKAGWVLCYQPRPSHGRGFHSCLKKSIQTFSLTALHRAEGFQLWQQKKKHHFFVTCMKPELSRKLSYSSFCI